MITNLNIGYNGRFGNQLFQFASVYGIAKKLNYEPIFPKKNITKKVIQNNADGKQFDARFQITECFDIDESFFSDNLKIRNYINEKHFHFDNKMFEIPDSTSLNGYFQSEKYFEHCKEEICKILQIKDSILEPATNFISKLNKNKVAIHIRRTDYLHLEGYHSLNGKEYVDLSIKEIGDVDNFQFIVCSDDTKWCEEIWGKNDNFIISKNNSAYVDFAIMSMCDHHIISNSSFSWWSSYLSKNDNKKIIAPKNWFGEKIQISNTEDLYTNKMIKI